ncbi:MAG TPA: RNA-processing protein [Candidatus Diapherotrites archaeon]|uniref:RNA-processing protein n=1 Tax=Candidatus Iainarchaeum sp. TaxID=3101447 RepID=A0A7J4JGR0_9ARCH|nr:RNA-processing protein [Candidatus Diapherotrites archaeon]HIH16943.1 RNA-processing protein [Candidatus Diapherotrites archaeon]
MQVEYLKVPQDRIAVLIGPKGHTKKEIERKCKVKLSVDSESGEAEISAKEDGFGAHKAASVVKALARGFSPGHAFRLFSDEYYLEVIELPDLLGKSSKAQQQKKGRVIGASGRAREEIEKRTGASVSVYGKTICIIGRQEEVERARNAVEMLLEGANHETVFDRLKKEMRVSKFEL